MAPARGLLQSYEILALLCNNCHDMLEPDEDPPGRGDAVASTIQLIDLLGAVALLLWGLDLIKTGVLAAFGSGLRQWLARGTRTRLSAAFWGFMATLGLQSSTATAVLIASFTARDLVRPRMAQAMMLGANLGTAVVTVILSSDLHWLGSVLILTGVWLSKGSGTEKSRAIGRAVLGLGLMLLALQLLGAVTAPLRAAPTVATVLAALADAPVIAVIVAAGLAVLGSSSLAVVVLIMMLAAAGVVGPELALTLVAGANLGGAVPPFLAVQGEGVAARRLTLANLIVRASGALAVVIFAAPLARGLANLTQDPGNLVVLAHLSFNLALLVIFLPILDGVGRLATRLLPMQENEDRAAPSYLDDSLLSLPEMALAVAAREALRLGDVTGAMLGRARDVLTTGDEAAIAAIAGLEQEVDGLHEAIKLYVARLNPSALTPQEERRAQEIMSYAINLEHVGDIVNRGLAAIAAKKARKKLSFSDEGLTELTGFFDHTRENLELSQAIFLSRDPHLARRLIDRKLGSRKLEAQSAALHLERVREGRAQAIETSAIHLDLLRDLKRINAHLASVAYPIMEELGELRETRLSEPGAVARPAVQ